MGQTAVLTQGTVFARGDGGSPEVFITVPNITSIAGPDASKNEIETTDLASTAKEYKGGLADFGRLTLEMQIVPGNAVHDLMYADFADTSSPVRNWKLTYVNGKGRNLSGYVASFPSAVQPDSVITGSVVIRLSGLPTAF